MLALAAATAMNVPDGEGMLKADWLAWHGAVSEDAKPKAGE